MMSGCDRKGQYPYSCIECWPNRPAYWCDSCYQRFAPKKPEEVKR
jgi:hypothetical protein